MMLIAVLHPGRPGVPARPAPGPKRLLWEVKTGGGQDRFVQLVPAEGRLLGLRAGALYAHDARSGRELWRFPKEGLANNPDPIFGHFILGVIGDCVITELPMRDGRHYGGVAAIRLADGELVREFEPEFETRYKRLSWEPLLGERAVFWAHDEDRLLNKVMVFDLVEWREVARFELPRGRGHLKASGARVFGIMQREGENFWRAFAVDLDRGEIRSVPLRSSSPVWFLLPDGGRLVADGRISAGCAFERPWPRARHVVVAGDGVYGRDERGLYRADPRDGSELWKFRPGSWDSLQLIKNTAATADVAAFYAHCYLHIIDAKTGALRAAVRVLEDEASAPSFRIPVACDGPRAYFASPMGLKCCSTRPVEPDRPDPDDPGDPAYALARCRRALLEGDFEDALKAIRGIGPLVGLRPACREEAAELLSQLSRSPASTFHPRLWRGIILSDGRVAGGLFREDYERESARLRYPRSRQQPHRAPEKAEKETIDIWRPAEPEVEF